MAVGIGTISLPSQFLIAVIMVFLGGLLLMISTKIFKLRNQTYKSALIISLIVGAIAFIFSVVKSKIELLGIGLFLSILSFLVQSVLGLFLIKKQYSLDWKNTFLVWIIWLILLLIIGGIITTIIVMNIIKSV